MLRIEGFPQVSASARVAFVYKLEKARVIDPWFDTKARLGVEFFTIATLAFINIHHYFIDNVLWRFKNTQVRDYLLT